MKNIWVVALLAIANIANAVPDIPSDEEMVKRGREIINKDHRFDATLEKATAAIATPKQSLVAPDMVMPQDYQSPMIRDLSKMVMGTDLKKQLEDFKNQRKGTDLFVFVSFSMPEDVLAMYSKEAKEAGATLVLRGFVDGSIKKTQQRALPLNKVMAHWEVNPALFRNMNIKRVPSIVLSDIKDSVPTEDGCAAPSSYLQVEGTISIRQALLIMRSEGTGPLATEARNRLAKLEGEGQ